MDSAGFFLSPSELWALIGTDRTPQIVDTRRRPVYEIAPGLIPGAVWREFKDIEQWSAEIDRSRPVVLVCRFGHDLSQTPAAYLRGDGYDARALEGGYTGWAEAGLPLVNKAALDRSRRNGQASGSRGGGRRSTASPAPG